MKTSRPHALLLVALLGVARPISAQNSGDWERAKASFTAGAKAYAAGDYSAAIQALDAAYALTPLPAIAFSLAQAERKQYGATHEREHLQRAVTLFQRYLEQEPNGARRSDAQLALTELEPQLGTKSAPSEPVKPQPRPTRLMIVSDTPDARISLDGAPALPSPLIREVPPGRHRAHVTASGYLAAEREVTAVSGELLMTEVRLAEKPTLLYVWAPAGAEIHIDGAYVGEGGPLFKAALASGSHQLVVAQDGKQLVRRDFELSHGRSHTEYVTLEPTQQRKYSELLFIASGAALTSGLLLSALAVRSQNRAEDFLSEQKYENVSPSQLIAYNASIIERDRYHTAAAVGFASSLGFCITALFLRELDRPSLRAATPTERRPREAAKTSPRLAFTPASPNTDIGAALQLKF